MEDFTSYTNDTGYITLMNWGLEWGLDICEGEESCSYTTTLDCLTLEVLQ